MTGQLEAAAQPLTLQQLQIIMQRSPNAVRHLPAASPLLSLPQSSPFTVAQPRAGTDGQAGPSTSHEMMQRHVHGQGSHIDGSATMPVHNHNTMTQQMTGMDGNHTTMIGGMQQIQTPQPQRAMSGGVAATPEPLVQTQPVQS